LGQNRDVSFSSPDSTDIYKSVNSVAACWVPIAIGTLRQRKTFRHLSRISGRTKRRKWKIQNKIRNLQNQQ